jgi:hemolysin activation/secretion protein
MQSSDAATVQSNGAYNKLGFNGMRLQSITDFTSFYMQVNGQFSSKNLDVSEKMELGGMYAVRAFPEGEAYADQGYVLNIEIRTLLTKISEKLSGKMQLIGFVDTGTVQSNKYVWTPELNTRTLSGAGVGLNWMGTSNFVLKTYYAHKLGDEAATSAPDKSGRFWIQGVKYF